MVEFKNRDVFEFCENLYAKLEEQDKGYYSSKHDKIVFQEAAKYFGISEDSAYKIYDSFNKLAVGIEMKKLNKLPNSKKKSVMMQNIQNIILNNKDLPFYNVEGNPVEPIISAMDIIEDEYKETILIIAQAGWTIPMTIDIERLHELKKCIEIDCDIDKFFLTFYTNKELDNLYEMIYDSISNHGQRKTFEESYEIFKQELYSACLTNLVTILEGILSTFGDNPQDIRMMRICNYHVSEERKNNNKLKSLCWQSVYEYIKILFEKSDFSKTEPDEINRHWLLHGRTSKTGDRLYCIKVINALSTLSNLQ